MQKGKGQINIEYIVSLTVYITLATYIAFQLSQQTPIYLRAVREEYVKSETYQLSELLTNNVGEPENWYTLWPSAPNNIKRLGLSEGIKTNVLSVEKIDALDEICSSDYNDVVDMLGIDTEDYQISIFVKDITNDIILLDCSPTVITAGGSIESIRRTVALGSGDYGELIIQTW
jgi:hypothetical protein